MLHESTAKTNNPDNAQRPRKIKKSAKPPATLERKNSNHGKNDNILFSPGILNKEIRIAIICENVCQDTSRKSSLTN